jgi:hypothetical protein
VDCEVWKDGRQVVGARLARASVTGPASLLGESRATASEVMSTYEEEQWLKVGINRRETAARVTAHLRAVSVLTLLPAQKQSVPPELLGSASKVRPKVLHL